MWILFIILFLIVTLLVFDNIKYYVYYKSSGIVIEKNSLKIETDLNNLDKVISNKKIKIKERNFAYTIKSISESLSSLDKTIEVILNIKLNDEINIINNIVEIKILEKEMTILEYIREKVGIF